jgi:hypothetical protein
MTLDILEVCHRILGAQQIQPEIFSPFTEHPDFWNLSSLRRQAQYQAGQSETTGSQRFLSANLFRQGQPVASNPWLPEKTFHSQLCQQHQPHLTAICQLTTAEQQILRLELSRSAVADNPHLQQYLSTNMEDPASNAFRSWARIFASLANSK